MPPAWSSAAEEVIAITPATDAAYVQSRAREFARGVGLSVRAEWAVAIVASELTTNIMKFGPPGTLTLRLGAGPPPALEIEAADRGPGFADLDEALKDGVSEGFDPAKVESYSAARRGLGLGLGAARRMTDALTIGPRPGGGSIVLARVHLPHRR